MDRESHGRESYEPVGFFHKSGKGDLVAVTERNPKLQALLRQRIDNYMYFNALLNEFPILNPSLISLAPSKKQNNFKRTKNASISLKEIFRKKIAVVELTSVCLGIYFGFCPRRNN